MRAFFILTLLPSLLWAQGAHRMMGRGPTPDAPPVLAHLLQMRTVRIQQSLGIPEDRAKNLAERWTRHDGEMMERARQAASLRAQFNEVLFSSASEEEKSVRIKPTLDRFLAFRTQQHEARRRFEEDIRTGLSPAQQVRLLLLMEEMQRNLRQGLRETLREGRRGQP